ncbi:MAG: hypothetical protein AAFP03_12475 [Cyanobacteria bacterium J06598_3]
MALTRLLSIFWATLWLPALGVIGFSLALTKPVLAEVQTQTRFEKHRSDRHRSKQNANQLQPLDEKIFPDTENSIGDISIDDISIGDISMDSLRLIQPAASGLGHAQNEPPHPRPPIGNGSPGASLTGHRQDQGSSMGDRISHRQPIDARGDMLEIRAQSESFQTLQIFDTQEEKESFTLALRRPFNRTRQSEFFWSLGFAYRNESPPPPPSQTAFSQPPLSQAPSRQPPPGEPPATLNSRTRLPVPPRAANNLEPDSSDLAANRQNPPVTGSSPSSALKMSTGVLEFAQGYRQQDRYGQWLVRSQFNLGTELTDSPTLMNADAQFFSWTGRLERTQSLNADNQLTLQLESQLSPNNLLPPHQFKVKNRGFENFAREARPANISGNNGIRLRLEDRMTLLRNSNTSASVITVVPFFDLGYTWGQSNPQKFNQQFSGRIGLGLSVQPLPGFDIQADYLTHWGDVSTSDNDQDVYVTFGYQTDW